MRRAPCLKSQRRRVPRSATQWIRVWLSPGWRQRGFSVTPLEITMTIMIITVVRAITVRLPMAGDITDRAIAAEILARSSGKVL